MTLRTFDMTPGQVERLHVNGVLRSVTLHGRMWAHLSLMANRMLVGMLSAAAPEPTKTTLTFEPPMKLVEADELILVAESPMGAVNPVKVELDLA